MAKLRSHPVVEKIRGEIARHDKPENRHNYQRFHKEKLKEPEGLKAPVLRKISNQCFKDVRHLRAKEILDLCDQLLATQERYMMFFAFEWAAKVKGQYVKADFKRFESWLEKYVNNWGACDHVCCGPLGHLILQYPELVKKTKVWTKSKKLYVRRAAAVCLMVPVKHKILLDEVFDTADRLLMDDEDLVQKGYGWMLKVAADVFEAEVFKYVMSKKDKMPRTALRYAIEKMPAARKRQAMARQS